MRVLGIAGSLRAGSYNRKLLRAAGELLPGGAELELFHGLAAVPPYDEDADCEPVPPAVRRLREAIEAADAVVIATPEYNSSVPGQLKNALDWASRPLATNVSRNKPVLVIGASTGMFGAVWAQAETRKVLGAMGARVVPGELAVGLARNRFDERGGLVDPDLRRQLATLLAELVAAATPDEVSRARAAVPARAA